MRERISSRTLASKRRFPRCARWAAVDVHPRQQRGLAGSAATARLSANAYRDAARFDGVGFIAKTARGVLRRISAASFMARCEARRWPREVGGRPSGDQAWSEFSNLRRTRIDVRHMAEQVGCCSVRTHDAPIRRNVLGVRGAGREQSGRKLRNSTAGGGSPMAGGGWRMWAAPRPDCARDTVARMPGAVLTQIARRKLGVFEGCARQQKFLIHESLVIVIHKNCGKLLAGIGVKSQ